VNYCLPEICALLGYYAAYSGNSWPTSRNNPSVLFSRVKKSKKKAGHAWYAVHIGKGMVGEWFSVTAYQVWRAFFLDFLTREDGTDRLSRNVVKDYNYTLRNNQEERRSIYLAAEAWNHAYCIQNSSHPERLISYVQDDVLVNNNNDMFKSFQIKNALIMSYCYSRTWDELLLEPMTHRYSKRNMPSTVLKYSTQAARDRQLSRRVLSLKIPPATSVTSIRVRVRFIESSVTKMCQH